MYRSALVFFLFLASILWSVFFLYSPLQTYFATVFNDCNGFSYDAILGRCNCQLPFNGTFCDQNVCVNGAPVFTNYGWTCECKDLWTGSLCDVCGTHDGPAECKAPLPYPLANKCRSEIVADGVEVEFLGPSCDLICVKSDNARAMQDKALEAYDFYLAKAPLDTIACPGKLCYGCDGTTREALCVDGALKSFNSPVCDVACGPCTDSFCKPCYRRGVCTLVGDQPQCQCPGLTRGPTCELLCPGVIETFNGLRSILSGQECNGNGVCNDEAACLCLEDPSGSPLFLGDACDKACPTDTGGSVCSGHGACVLEGTATGCECDAGWFGPACGCNDGTTAAKTCLHGECNEDVLFPVCSCHDDDLRGHWDGEFCQACASDWFAPSTFCLQYCNVEETCNGNAGMCTVGDTVTNEEGLVVPCSAAPNGDGTLSLSGTCATCACGATFQQATFLPPADDRSLFQQCAQCLPDYYPQVGTTPVPATLPFCSVQCDSATCNDRGVCLKNSGECVCHGACPTDTSNVDGQCLTPSGRALGPFFSAASNCAVCDEHWGPNIEGGSFWENSCRYYCNPLATESSAFPAVCYEADGVTIRQDCVFCSGRADNCTTFTAQPTCNCREGFAGDYCESTCDGSATCNNGRCVSNDLANWFNIKVPAYQRNQAPADGRTGSWRCACDPQDIGLAERDAYEEGFYALATYGLDLKTAEEALPQRPEYFGLQCSAECPRVTEACDGRGFCKSIPTGLSTEYCDVDSDCSALSDGAEDVDRYCYLEKRPRFFKKLVNLPPATLAACTASEIEWIGSFVDTYDWERFCYNYVSQSIPPDTHSSECKDCDALTGSTELWGAVNEKCAALVQYANFETLQGFTEKCSGECTQAVATFDWYDFCNFPNEDFNICPSECTASFETVDWVSNNGFCGTLEGFLQNHALVGQACAPFREEDALRGRDHDQCTQVTEGTSEYEIATSCFVRRETTLNDFGVALVQPYSGTEHQILCHGVAAGKPQVCGVEAIGVRYNTTTETGEAFTYCQTLYPNGWSDFARQEYVVETRATNHSTDEYTTAAEAAVLVRTAVEVLGGALGDASVVFYEGLDGVRREGVLVGECRLSAPRCLYCGDGDSLRNGTGAVILPEQNPSPEKCCATGMYLQKSLDGNRYWCHELNSVGVENCRYDRCAAAVQSYNWKATLNKLDTVYGLADAPIPALERASVRRGVRLDAYCAARLTLDDAVREGASGVNAFQEYCEFVKSASPVYGIAKPIATFLFDAEEDAVPETIKLDVAKKNYWDSNAIGDALVSYDETFFFAAPYSAAILSRAAREFVLPAAAASAVSAWVYLPAEPYRYTFFMELADSRGSLRWAGTPDGNAETGKIARVDVRRGALYVNYAPTDVRFDSNVAEWYHIVVYMDWENYEVAVEVGESAAVVQPMLCRSLASNCMAYEEEEVYENALNGVLVKRAHSSAGVYDAPYTEGNASVTLEGCAAQYPNLQYFAHSSGVCHFYNSDPTGADFTSTASTDPTLYVYQRVVPPALALNQIEVSSPEGGAALHDLRAVSETVVGSYLSTALNAGGRSTTVSADDCAAFVARPTGADSLDDRLPVEELTTRPWGRICEDLRGALALTDDDIDGFCFENAECEASVRDFVATGAADWFFSFADSARPNATRTACNGATVACENLLENFDYESLCDRSLRDVYDACDGSCAATFTDWRAGRTDPAFNKSDFCRSLNRANDDVHDTFLAGLSECSEGCRDLSDEVNYLDFCSTRLATHNSAAPYTMSYNLSSYCRRQVFSALKDELADTEDSLDFTRDCKNLAERASTVIVNDKPGVCHRVICQCTQAGMSGTRCNIECPIGSGPPASPCNEATGLGTCCLSPTDGQELSFLTCQTDYTPAQSSYTVGECLCNNRGGSLIAGVNCDETCQKCSESFGQCSPSSGTCLCKNNEYMETVAGQAFVAGNLTAFDAVDEDSGLPAPLLFDWANAETTDGAAAGDFTVQVGAVLLYDPLRTCARDGLDKCCAWEGKLATEDKNPLDPNVDVNRLDALEGAADMDCAAASYEACLAACLDQPSCESISYDGEGTRIVNKQAAWPLPGQVSLSPFAVAQEPFNFFPSTSTITTVAGGKCPSYALQSGRYRVLYQNGLYAVGQTCGVGTGTSEALGEPLGTVREAYVACQALLECDGFVREDATTVRLFSGYTVAGCSLETHARPGRLPRPVGTSPDILYRNNWCAVAEYMDLAGTARPFTEGQYAFGLVSKVDCTLPTSVASFPFHRCRFPFYVPVWDPYRNAFVTQKMDSCTDLNIVDGYTGKSVVRDASGVAASSVLVDFESLKDEIRMLTGIEEPKYCVSEPYFQNMTHHLQAEDEGKPFSTCRENKRRRNRCTKAVEDSGEGNCRCGAETTCEVDEYCYEKVVNKVSLFECHRCDDPLSPAPETCCEVGQFRQVVREGGPRCIDRDDQDFLSYCNVSWGCPRNWGPAARDGDFYTHEAVRYAKGTGPKPELWCENTCWNYKTGACGCDGCGDFLSPLRVLRGIDGGTKIGGHYGAAVATDGSIEFTTDGNIPIPFLRICKDPNAGAIENSPYAFTKEKEREYRDMEFIRSNKATASNPSSRCGIDCQSICPGLTDSGVPCSGRGQCGTDCACSCFSLDAIGDRTYFLTALRGGGLGEVPDYTVSSFRSPYRGVACESVCPGFDERYTTVELSDADKLFIMTEKVCGGRGSCLLNQQGVTQCTCEVGYESGSKGACEFHCPGEDGLCSGHGTCSVESVGTSQAYVDGLVRVYTDLVEEDPVVSVTVASNLATVVLQDAKLVLRGGTVRFGDVNVLTEGHAYTIAEVLTDRSFTVTLPAAAPDAVSYGGVLLDDEFSDYDPRVTSKTVSHRMTSYVFDTNELESAYSSTNGRYYMSPAAREAVDPLMRHVRYLSKCPAEFPYVYHHGLHCCAFENSANGTFLNELSPVRACPRKQRMGCPTIEWFEQNTALSSDVVGGTSRFLNRDGKTSVSFFCKKAVLTSEEERRCAVERRELEQNIFTTDPLHYTCDASIDLVRVVRETRPYYDAWGILELGSGRTDGLLYTYSDIHCRNVVPAETNTNGLGLDVQPQPIVLLQCAMCQCQRNAESGYWDGSLVCDDCSYAFSGEGCKKPCAGTCGTISVGSNLMFYEEYQTLLGITKPCDSPQQTGFFYSCPAKADLREITEASGQFWDSGDVDVGGTDTGYERAVFCQDGRNAGGSCVRCKVPMVGTIDTRFSEAPERSCVRLTCPRVDGKLKQINKLEGEFSIGLSLSMWQSDFSFPLYGKDPDGAYKITVDRGLSRSLPIDLFAPCEAGYVATAGDQCCDTNCKEIERNFLYQTETERFTDRFAFFHDPSDHTGGISDELPCAGKALSGAKYPIYANGAIVAYSPLSYFDASKGFFAMRGGECLVYKGFETYSLLYFERAQSLTAKFNGLLAFTSQSIVSETVQNFRASYTCNCPTVSKTLNVWAGTDTHQEHSTAVTVTYELGCVFNNDYAAILEKGQDAVQDGLLERTLNPYVDSSGADISNVELVSLIQKDTCTRRFFENCAQGHDLGFQNPFLTYYAFSTLEEYLRDEYPSGANQDNRCDYSIYKSRLWCPQCPRCHYKGQIPGVDLELESGECTLGYFPYCEAKASACGSSSWRTNPDCALPSFAPSFQLKDPERQTVDLINATKVSMGSHTPKACALMAMVQSTKQGFWFQKGCDTDACECFFYTSVPDADSVQVVDDGYLYVIDYTSTFGAINPFEEYINQFMRLSPSGPGDMRGWMVEKMRQAVPDKYRAWTVPTNGTFLKSHQQWLECSCTVGTGNDEGRDWCENFDVTRCVKFLPVQMEWQLLWHDRGSRTEGVLPQLERGALHDPSGFGAVLRTGGTMQSNVEKIVVAVPDTCDETLPLTTEPEYENTQFVANQLECGHEESIYCVPPEANRSVGYLNFNPERLLDGLGKTVAHYRCKERVATGVTIGQCANEAFKRFSVYEDVTWASRGYFTVERPQLDSSLFSAHRDYEVYDFDTSTELDCWVYKNVDLAIVRQSAWNGQTQPFCAAGGDVRDADIGCARSAALYTSSRADCTDCDATLPQYGGECSSPEFVRTYRIPNLQDAGGVPMFTLQPLVVGPVTCFQYGPCFSDTEVWPSCRTTLRTGSVSSLHYPMYSETPLHDMDDAKKQALGIPTDENYLENADFTVSFGFWTEVRDMPAGTDYSTHLEDILNLCYDDGKLSDAEKVILSNRELFRLNDYSRYDLLTMDLECPEFVSRHMTYHRETKGRFAASAWADGTRNNADDEKMLGSGHTKAVRISVEGKQSNYINLYALIILDIDFLETGSITVSAEEVSYDDAIAPYCDSGTQQTKRYGPCLDLKGASVNGGVFWKGMGTAVSGKVGTYQVKQVPTTEGALPVALDGDLYIEHDCAILVHDNGVFYELQDFVPRTDRALPVEAFSLYVDTGRAETAHKELMFTTLYRNLNGGLSGTADVCAPMSQDLSGLSSKLTEHTSVADAPLLAFRQIDAESGFAPMCQCQAGYSNKRYSDYNQPFELHSGCSAPAGDYTGTMIEYKQCFGPGSCSDYGTTPYCAGFDSPVPTSYSNVCVNATGHVEMDHATEGGCNRPFGGCKFGQRNALAIDAISPAMVECQGAQDLSQTYGNMAAEWVSPHDPAFVIDPSAPRTQYVGDDPAQGVVYVDGVGGKRKSIDRARSNFNFLTAGCHACTNGRFTELSGEDRCLLCGPGSYNIDTNNPWRIPPAMNAMGTLPQDRWKDPAVPAYEYEWWKIASFPSEDKEWSEVNEWQIMHPEPAYYLDDTGHWQYDSMKSLKPAINPGWAAPQHVHTGCASCPDNYASVPLSLECTEEGKTADECTAGNLLHEVGDTREGYNYPGMGNRATQGNRNCLACPPGYDTGNADHHASELGDLSTGPLHECPIAFPYAFSVSETAPMYGSHCCAEQVDMVGDRFSYGYFYSSPDEACTGGTCTLARKDSVCMLAAYGQEKGSSMTTVRSLGNNLRFCNAIGGETCEGSGQTYRLHEDLDECRCHEAINETTVPTNDTSAISCFPKRLWDFKGNCEYTKYIGKRYRFDRERLLREKEYTVHVTDLNRAAAQYSAAAEEVWDLNPSDIIESNPVVHRLNLSLSFREQCEAMASAEAAVDRFSVNRVTGDCVLVYYVDDDTEQRLREDTQICQAYADWEAYDLKLSAKDVGARDTFFFTENSCDAYAYRSEERQEAWMPSPANATVANVAVLFEEKHPYGASVERLESSPLHASFGPAARECLGLQNCIGVATDSQNGIVQVYFAARHTPAFDDAIRHQGEQSLFYYRKKLVVDLPYVTSGYYYQCQTYADVEATGPTSLALDCNSDPMLCYQQCRALAEAAKATAFTYPTFPVGEGTPGGDLLCTLYSGDAAFRVVGEVNDFAGPVEFLQKSACLRIKNQFQTGWVVCDADYTSGGLETTNNFYCADHDYRMHGKGYDQGHHSVENALSLHKTCLVEQVGSTGVCFTDPVLGTCSSYNHHGKCDTVLYEGFAEFPSPNTTVTEQDQRGTCVQIAQSGTCTSPSLLGTCTESSVLTQGNRYENPLGVCKHEDGTVTIGRLAECDNMHSYEAFHTQAIGNFNAEALYYGPVKQMHINALSTIKQFKFLTEDVSYYCEKACTDTSGCLAYSVENRVPEPKELAPWHTPSFRNCSLFAGPVILNENVSASHTTLFDGDEEDLFYYKSTVYSGRANSDAELMILRDLKATGTACMTACDNEPLCVGYAYNATGACELLATRPDRASLYKKEGPLVPFLSATRGAYSTFDEAYDACERRSVPFNPYKQRLGASNACVGIRNQSNSFSLIEGVHYGGISVVAEGQVFDDSSCYVEHASVASAADCEVFAQSVPFSLAFEGEEQRYGKVFFFSYDTSGLCRVIKPGFSLATCTTSSGAGLLYQSIGDAEVRMTVAGVDIVYTNRRDAGSLDVSPAEHALFKGGYHGSLADCSKSLGNADTSMECIAKAIDEPAELVEANQSIVADTNGTCERLNDRGTLEQPNTWGHCKGQSEYGDCVREVPHGVCTEHSGKGQCVEYSTCEASVLGETNKGRCYYRNEYGQCTYETRLGVCKKESNLGRCEFRPLAGRCLYNDFDGQCEYIEKDHEVQMWLEPVDGGPAVQLFTVDGDISVDGIGSAELPIVPFSPSFVPHQWPTNNGREYYRNGEYYHSESLRMKKRSIAMENERAYYTAGVMVSATKSTIQVLELGASWMFADSDDNCELQCQKHAMLQFDGSNDTQEWYHQVQPRTLYAESPNIFLGQGELECDGEDDCKRECAVSDKCDGFSAPMYESDLTEVSELGGYEASCYVKSGTVFCRGPNGYGQLGRGLPHDSQFQEHFEPIVDIGKFAMSVATGEVATCVLYSDNTVYCVGRIFNLGHSRTDTTGVWYEPTHVQSSVVQLVSGGIGMYALLDDGRVAAWGQDDFLGNGAHFGDLNANRGNRGWGVVFVSGVSTAVKLSSLAGATCALLESGGVKCWGRLAGRGFWWPTYTWDGNTEGSIPVEIFSSGIVDIDLPFFIQEVVVGYAGTTIKRIARYNLQLAENTWTSLCGCTYDTCKSVLCLAEIGDVEEIYGGSMGHGCVRLNVEINVGTGVGKLFCIGRNEHGELGIGEAQTPPPDSDSVVEVSRDQPHVLTIMLRRFTVENEDAVTTLIISGSTTYIVYNDGSVKMVGLKNGTTHVQPVALEGVNVKTQPYGQAAGLHLATSGASYEATKSETEEVCHCARGGIARVCPAGFFMHYEGQNTSYASMVELAQNGTLSAIFLAEMREDAPIDCSPCPVGFDTVETDYTTCEPCLAGSYNDIAGGACKGCSGGQYSDQAAQSGCQTCDYKVGGASCNAGSHVSAQCSSGSASDTSACTACVVGKYSDQTGQAGCTKCPDANYQDQTGETSCEECPAGRWGYVLSSNDGPGYHDSLDDCQLCWAGRYSSQTGLLYSSFLDDKCTACPANPSGVDEEGCDQCNFMFVNSQCVNCETGRYISGSACTDCVAGQYQNEKGKTSCKACSSGYGSGAGATSCSQCVAGQYSNNGVCTACSCGKIAPSAGAASCSNCPTGKYGYGGGGTTCSFCRDLYHAASPSGPCTFCNVAGYSGGVGNSNPAGLCGCNQCTGSSVANPPDGCTACDFGSPSLWSDPGVAPHCSTCGPIKDCSTGGFAIFAECSNCADPTPCPVIGKTQVSRTGTYDSSNPNYVSALYNGKPVQFGACQRCEDSFLAMDMVGCPLEVGDITGPPPDTDYSCFPNDALATTRNGTKRMDELKIGDEVLTDYGFEIVYFSGHNDSNSVVNTYVKILDDANRSITLTKEHFIRVNGEYQYAGLVRVGDSLTNGNKVTRVLLNQLKKGMHNPFTMSGTITVNNVSASCHSSWFFENTISWLKPPTKYIPAIYQNAMYFIRQIYKHHPEWVKRFLGDKEHGAQNEDLWKIVKKMYYTF